MNTNKKVVISTRRLKANASKNRYGEPVLEVVWNEYDCGVSMLQDSRKISVFACDKDLGAALVAIWNSMKMNEMIKECYAAKGEKGFIKASHFFMKYFAETTLAMFAKFEAEESSIG